MAQSLDLKRLLATGRQLTETGRSQAVQLGSDLVEQGRQATEQISAAVDELVSRGGRDRIEELRQTIRGEVQQQLRTLAAEIKDHLAAQGQLAAERIAAAVDAREVQQRKHEEELREVVRDEVQRQLTTLGLATREDLVALGRAIRDDRTTPE
jgi:polyhydroxyalkanoate synthesis regulator phasin